MIDLKAVFVFEILLIIYQWCDDIFKADNVVGSVPTAEGWPDQNRDQHQYGIAHLKLIVKGKDLGKAEFGESAPI